MKFNFKRKVAFHIAWFVAVFSCSLGYFWWSDVDRSKSAQLSVQPSVPMTTRQPVVVPDSKNSAMRDTQIETRSESALSSPISSDVPMTARVVGRANLTPTRNGAYDPTEQSTSGTEQAMQDSKAIADLSATLTDDTSDIEQQLAAIVRLRVLANRNADGAARDALSRAMADSDPRVANAAHTAFESLERSRRKFAAR